MNSGMTLAAAPLALTALLLAGCGGVSDLTKERVTRSETSVQQAQQTIGNSEQGAIELQRAKDNLDHARQAIKDGKEQPAQRYAQLAQLDAELAVAKSQSASARNAADELIASIKQLRQEAQRSATTPTDDTDSVPAPQRTDEQRTTDER
jgi:chromosome segregation ATPase